MPLTPKQIKFAEEYIKCGNATEAAKRAGYKPETAYHTGYENLRKPQISSYIAQRMAGQNNQLVAEADEVLRFYTSVMRGEIKDQFGLDPSLSDRLKAGDSLMKRYAAAAEKNKSTLEKLDVLLSEFKDAVKSETN